jgi:hypothetical protein
LGWDYNLTVLGEAISKIIARFDLKNSIELAKNYPKIKYRLELEELMRDIGLELIGFPKIRDKVDFAIPYGILPPPPPVQPQNTQSNNQTTTPPSGQSNPQQTNNTNPSPQNSTIPTNVQNPISNNSQTATTLLLPSSSSNSPKAVASNDPKYVTSLIKKFSPRGANRQKVVTLRDELKQLDIKKNPLAFCFILRSMFEISAKAFASDNSISLSKSNGNDKSLVELLWEITSALTSNNSNKTKVKVLHGAIAELGRTDGLLSVTSMNQLVHNPNFSVTSNDICNLFGNIYPLIEEMN